MRGAPERALEPIHYGKKAEQPNTVEASPFPASNATGQIQRREFIPSPDGRWLVTNEDGKHFYIWDLASEIQRPQRYPLLSQKQPDTIVFSADSSALITAEQGVLEVRLAANMKDAKYQLGLPASGGRITAAALSHDGRWLAVSGSEGTTTTLWVWDLAAAKPSAVRVIRTGTLVFPSEVFISPDGQRVLLADLLRATVGIARVTDEGLLTLAAQVAGRNPSAAEWKQLGIPLPYQKVFPSLPLPSPGVNLNAMTPRDDTGAAEAALAFRDGLAQIASRLTAGDPHDKVRPGSYCKVFTVALQQGSVYQVDLHSKAFDAFLRLEDAAGQPLAFDDDGGGYLNSRIVFACPATGTYRLIATSFVAGATGDFTLTAQANKGAVLPPATPVLPAQPDGKTSMTR